jgi:hypothetical protein
MGLKLVMAVSADELTIYIRGLYGDDSQPAGAGYSITSKGMVRIAITKGVE